MQSAMCRTVAEHFGSRPFLWTLPRPRDAGGVKDRFWKGGGTAFDPKLRLPGRSFGLNDWRNYVNVALLSVINLSGEQLRLLALLGLNKEAVFDAMTATILYQDLLGRAFAYPPTPVSSNALSRACRAPKPWRMSSRAARWRRCRLT